MMKEQNKHKTNQYITELKERVLREVNQNPKKIINGFFGEYRWLSNFHPCNIEFDGFIYPSTEHAYMAMKTFNLEEREKIRSNNNPSFARKYGQTISLRQDWETVKIECMRFCLEQKFKKGTELGDKLIATGNAMVVEGNWWCCNFWGSCVCDRCGNKGQNNLGKLLTQIREGIK